LPARYQNQTFYVEGVGTAIKLLPTENFVTPEEYTTDESIPFDLTPYDSDNFDANLNAPTKHDYLTINRASPDLNAWSRGNRWFHIDVLRATAEYNNQVVTIDNTSRGKRPILEFRSGMRIYNFGTRGKQPVDVIDFTETDALSNINGTIGYGINGYTLIEGSRVIFAADIDNNVRNRVYEVHFIKPDSVAPIIAQPIIDLVPAYDANVLFDETVVCLNGITLQGQSFWYDGVAWILAQNKIGINQAPLFNIYDQTGFSIADRTKYPSSTFIGSKLFSYAVGTGTKDTTLGFPLKYLTLNNVGDIVFDNNFYNDTFIYVQDGASITENVSIGFSREYSNRTDYQSLLGWQTAATKSQVYQQFEFIWDGTVLKLDIQANLADTFPGVKIYIEGKFVDPTNYVVTVTDIGTDILMLNEYVLDTVLEVLVLSDQVSRVGFYQVPGNLECNPLNENATNFTLGTIRNHYQTIAENLKSISGTINGANNTRDLGDIVPYGLVILQQSSPLTLAGYFMRSPAYNIFDSLQFNGREYIKFKAQMFASIEKEKEKVKLLEQQIYELSNSKGSKSMKYFKIKYKLVVKKIYLFVQLKIRQSQNQIQTPNIAIKQI
jgi:hypothetical protein